MKRLFIIVALSLSLGGCFNPFQSISNPVSATNIYQGELAFDAALKVFNEGKDLCGKRVLPPACRTYVIKGQALIPQIRKADLDAKAWVIANPTLDATNVVQVFTGLLQSFQGTSAALAALKS